MIQSGEPRHTASELVWNAGQKRQVGRKRFAQAL